MCFPVGIVNEGEKRRDSRYALYRGGRRRRTREKLDRGWIKGTGRTDGNEYSDDGKGSELPNYGRFHPSRAQRDYIQCARYIHAGVAYTCARVRVCMFAWAEYSCAAVGRVRRSEYKRERGLRSVWHERE